MFSSRALAEMLGFLRNSQKGPASKMLLSVEKACDIFCCIVEGTMLMSGQLELVCGWLSLETRHPNWPLSPDSKQLSSGLSQGGTG